MMRSNRPRNRFQPRLESLEDRFAPAVTINQTGETLVLQGDAAPDAVNITAVSTDRYAVSVGGVARGEFAGVSSIDANLGEGGNAIVLALAQDADVNVTINTGSGVDVVRVRLGGTTRTDQELNLTVNTGDGIDDFALAATTPAEAAGNPAGDN